MTQAPHWKPRCSAKTTCYLRLIAQIAIYLRRTNFQGDWQAVVLFARRSMDPGIPQSYRIFETSGQV